MPFSPGDPVHVAALGKAIVREVRSRGRYLVELKGRTMIVAEEQLMAVEEGKRRRRAEAAASIPGSQTPDALVHANAPASIDLHGMTTAEAVTAVDAFLNDAILASLAEVRIIHGRSGGRLKSAVHTRLRELQPVRAFRVDPRNPGVTIVAL